MNAANVLQWLRENVESSAQLCLDSRQIEKGDVFFASPGMAGDGRSFIDSALERGAAAIVSEKSDSGAAVLSVPSLEVENLSGMLGEIAHEWWAKPSEELKVIAVTGTNGKTSCVQWIAAALNNSQVPCGTIGTLGVTLPDGTNLGGALTTPDVLSMHRNLALLRDAGANLVALEASSIGIAQGRLDGVHVEIAAFTNISHDHLDYHLTVQNYREAKARLFAFSCLRSAVINADDDFGQELLRNADVENKVSYSMKDSSAVLFADDLHTGADGQVFRLITAHGTAQILTRLLGDHNVSNLLLVSGVLHELGWPVAKIARLIATLGPVPGRLEIVESVSSLGKHVPAPLVVVDYAHTPDALERALEALAAVAQVRGGKLICVFGCGGDRDTAKRPLMGEIAGRLADEVIVTNDNPRSEDPDAIIQEILQGLKAAHQIEQDRAKAILQAVWFAEPADLVLVAGKGHETHQEVKGVRYVFDDREWASFALSWLRGPALCTDTRSLQRQDLFVAIKGDHFDGHEYLLQAAEKGACGAIVETPNLSLTLPQFVLGDTRQALLKIAAVWRQKFDIPVVAVCGSNGKTTTKEMIASIFRSHFGVGNTVATIGNLNNDLGVPLSVLRLRANHQAAVFELGMNHPGEIAVLARIASPTIALVNNAQREHQEFMHTVHAVAEENGAVLSALAADGVAIFPGDDAYTTVWEALSQGKQQLKFGFGSKLEVRAEQIHANPTHTPFQLHVLDQEAPVILMSPGVHNLRNALAASACSFAAGVELNGIVTGLQDFRPVEGRMQPKTLIDGFQLIDDSYNANPDSVRAAIDVLAQLKGPTVLVLGNMGEVGVNSQAVHAEMGNYAREQGIKHLLVLGADAAFAAQAYGSSAQSYENIDVLITGLIELAPAHILVKGSRSTRMDRVVRALEKHFMEEEGASNAS
ncbi:bifunctional UDP-N-acetylmuramoyl-L-alanyl-D-glutamate--2,6-diaminopimelate ligase MurE/UDP-N-acetylmuramoyl-tripeptide--D-alanyl-D-alanine ligase MurF [Paenalcaligenes niemegkensis]|uniref:bifunctional UDP-N-acetylmuramoyl-L-alanyl-D-glutamate--2, 6-diaminopimelate ligase MurE/UDP-N-acetylmuramoyl-tripeptide--D-alanyl-D-alanine ligase MurF n=1 Tax=Paenalcaligenes niemegkensis TaxID=2895469 RepID=UPI001EE952FA|nr:bifunctional UDP-N-acetylmuramoyl-L-alanyl-D-glutamate--2,6-diaminopimelate ligase MurE/UDP-N-acetylmuramoyl-tripeptide--D-alanyl-D-alanine ligase MurF [Paenalcaligenes niemegkensis]MCQ9615886.1 bifunctional UDP-N-acetylmuramoyl-L-alanyl-D-glutamate--2,6-diaminopimelate ligase MurE/UDP-N-acetylmuramoyl-tripeptide--D-alanyl-D-alanine ligase MurF [Paenalcaligenes niemegkensis]